VDTTEVSDEERAMTHTDTKSTNEETPKSKSNQTVRQEGDATPRVQITPYDSVFRNNVALKLKDSKAAITSLSSVEFAEIKWPNEYPSIVSDIFEYLTDINLEMDVVLRKKRAAEEKFMLRFVNEAKKMRANDPNCFVDPEDLIE
jgi:hypothetical protein